MSPLLLAIQTTFALCCAYHATVTTLYDTTTATRSPLTSAISYRSFNETTGFKWYWWTKPGFKSSTVGTVMVVVDKLHNKTSTTTKYHTNFALNSSQTLWTRTDVNTLGTVTAVAHVKTSFGTTKTVTLYVVNTLEMQGVYLWLTLPRTYPSGYDRPIFDNPTFTGDAACCGMPSRTTTETSTSTSKSSTTSARPTSDDDPKGLFAFIDEGHGGYSRNCSIWTVNTGVTPCICTACVATQSIVAPGTTVSSEGYILATTTSVLDGPEQ